jgi:tetratricopeptide (TPR) repeat protein
LYRRSESVISLSRDCSTIGAIRWAIMAVLLAASPLSAQKTEHPELLRAIEAYEAGDLPRALEILRSTPALLGIHDSAVRSVYTGLVQFAQGQTEQAGQSFARAIRAEPGIRLDPAVHSPSRLDAFEFARGIVVTEWRREAQAAETRGDEPAALASWRQVLAAAPTDPEAIERLGVLDASIRQREAAQREAQRQSAADSLRAEPPAEEVSNDADASERQYNPGQALAMGLVVPGLGEVYTNRRTVGLLAFAGAAGAIAAGYLSERIEVDCRSVPVNNVCPPGDVLDEKTARPYLAPAIAAAAGITLIAAIDAMLAARRANARAAAIGDRDRPQDGVRLVAPAIITEGTTLRAELLRVRFR